MDPDLGADFRTYRFSEAVAAIDSTPKSLRRWLETLGIKSEDGGWLTFTPAQLMMFGVMRHCVDWGIPITDAANLALLCMAESMAPGAADELLGDDLPSDRVRERLEQSPLSGMSLFQLTTKFLGHEVYVTALGGTYGLEFKRPAKFPVLDLLSPKSANLPAFGSYLTISLGHVAYRLLNNLRGEGWNLPHRARRVRGA